MMATNSFPFKVLFWFENDSKVITEIKRTDIQSDTADKSIIYKWLIIQKEKQNENEKSVSALTFKSMDSSGKNHIRTFAEGKLEWDAEHVRFNGEPMRQIEPNDLSTESLEMIGRFLDSDH